MSRRKGGLCPAHLKAVRTGCPKAVYGSVSRISRVDPAIEEDRMRKEAQRDLEGLFSPSRAEPKIA